MRAHTHTHTHKERERHTHTHMCVCIIALNTQGDLFSTQCASCGLEETSVRVCGLCVATHARTRVATHTQHTVCVVWIGRDECARVWIVCCNTRANSCCNTHSTHNVCLVEETSSRMCGLCVATHTQCTMWKRRVRACVDSVLQHTLNAISHTFARAHTLSHIRARAHTTHTHTHIHTGVRNRRIGSGVRGVTCCSS